MVDRSKRPVPASSPVSRTVPAILSTTTFPDGGSIQTSSACFFSCFSHCSCYTINHYISRWWIDPNVQCLLLLLFLALFLLYYQPLHFPMVDRSKRPVPASSPVSRTV